ncbi:MAG TPA: DUF1365 domain-containing protein [Campylobacterales bacterium]|nr:DUF1365 domain-containing protein [Campylobacterales bacterium]
MSHQLLRGSVYHKRYHPKTHDFTYRFFMLDIDVTKLDKLKSKYFSINKFNLFAFYAKDHFGQSSDFKSNIQNLLHEFNYNTKLQENDSLRFVTLPRMMGFVFNPISLLILYRDKKPYAMLVEVHNYDGGRIVYPVDLTERRNNHFQGSTAKDMYVSPFLERDGNYDFLLENSNEKFRLHITYTKSETKKLTATLNTKPKPFNDKELLKVFFLYPLLTLGVVVQTVWQSLRLRQKGLTWYDPLPLDQQRRS